MNLDIFDGIMPPHYSKEFIIRSAEELTESYVWSVSRSICPEFALLGISFDVLFERIIYPRYEIVLIENQDLGYDENGKKILGAYDPLKNTAYIDPSLHPKNNDPRRAFTLWHEVGGHGILQGNWLRKELNRLRRESLLVSTEDVINLKTENILERQANIFAAHAAAPTWLVNFAIRSVFRFEKHTKYRFLGRREYTFCVGNSTRPCFVENFQEFCNKIAYYIRPRFGGLSVESLSYRVAESRLVIDKSTESFRLHRSTHNRKLGSILPDFEMQTSKTASDQTLVHV